MNKIKIFLVLLFFIGFIRVNAQNHIKLVCHDSIWPSSDSLIYVKEVKIFGNLCSDENLKRISLCKGLEVLIINSFEKNKLPFKLDFPELKEIRFVACPNLDYDELINGMVMNNKLQILEIVRCGISEIPVALFNRCRKLEKIDLSHNLLVSIPSLIYDLKELESLKLNNNKIEVIDLNWKEFEKLRQLDISYNKIFFEEFKFSALSESNLIWLSLSNCSLDFFPRELSTSKLKYIDLSGNNIVSIPYENKFKNLETLILTENNNLINIPESFKEVVFQAKGLKVN